MVVALSGRKEVYASSKRYISCQVLTATLGTHRAAKSGFSVLSHAALQEPDEARDPCERQSVMPDHKAAMTALVG